MYNRLESMCIDVAVHYTSRYCHIRLVIGLANILLHEQAMSSEPACNAAFGICQQCLSCEMPSLIGNTANKCY